MSHLQFYAYPGYGENAQKELHYSQAVRVGDRIECAGQGTKDTQINRLQSLTGGPGGWDPATSKINTEINAQIDQAFANVELNLKNAGGKGWSQVFRVHSYHVPLNDEVTRAMVRNFKKYMPNHRPLWTVLGVSRLGYDDMRVEIEVTAHDPEGAA